MTKLRLMANKVKHVLSANSDSPVFIESLQDDLSLSMTITRAEFEQVCHDLFLRASVPVQTALRSANLTLEQIDSVELIGGGMRIPKFQEELSKVLGSKLELGMHINSDESMALGAAFHGANVSTAFKVRHVGMTDVNPFSIQVSLETIEEVQKRSLLGGLFGIGSTKKAAVKDEKETIEAEATSTADESAVSDGPWQKKTTLFSTFGKVGIKKTIAFTQDQDVHCSLDYEPTDYLPEGTE
jgi:hypoxia up-regulated 1